MYTPETLIDDSLFSYLNVFKEHFSMPQYAHLVTVTHGLLSGEWEGSISALASKYSPRDQSSLNRFITGGKWKGHDVDEARRAHMLNLAELQPGKYYVMPIDDTLCDKSGTSIETVSRHYDHCDRKSKLSQCLVTSYFVTHTIKFPLFFEFYLTKSTFKDENDFKSKIDIAKTIINRAPLIQGKKGVFTWDVGFQPIG